MTTFAAATERRPLVRSSGVTGQRAGGRGRAEGRVVRASELLGSRKRAVRWAVVAEEAACASVGGELSEAFFSTDPGDIGKAQAVCALCPVQLQCLAGGLARGEQWGVWGGWAFEPRTVEAATRRVSGDAPSDHNGGVIGGRSGRRSGTGWEVWTTDVLGVRHLRGLYTSTTVAVAAAERWVEDGRWRAEIGRRFAKILDAIAADSRDGSTPERAPVEVDPTVQLRRVDARSAIPASRSRDAA